MNDLKGSRSESGGSPEMSRKELLGAWAKVVVVETEKSDVQDLLMGFV